MKSDKSLSKTEQNQGRTADKSDVGAISDGEAFRPLRKSRKLSQCWVAAKCGCSASLISKWGKGHYSPTKEFMELITEVRKIIESIELNSLNEHKYCWKCETSLSVTAFGRDSSRPNGLQSKCLSCNTETVKKWRDINWDKMLNNRKVKRKLDSAHLRQAGWRWTKSDSRSITELNLLRDNDELHLREKPFSCSPTRKGESRKNLGYLDEANQLLSDFEQSRVIESPTQESLIDVYGRKLKSHYDEGRVSEIQARRLVKLFVRRPGSALE